MDTEKINLSPPVENKKNDRPLFKEIGFERYMRLMGLAEELTLPGAGSYTVLDVGSHDSLLKNFLPDAGYFSYNGLISKEHKTFFADNSYDIVVAADVLEHVPFEDRETFILELLRLARRKVVFSYPTEKVAVFEKFALSLVPGHRWLKEHVETGLPAKKDVDAVLDGAGIPYAVKYNHGLASWLCSFIILKIG